LVGWKKNLTAYTEIYYISVLVFNERAIMMIFFYLTKQAKKLSPLLARVNSVLLSTTREARARANSLSYQTQRSRRVVFRVGAVQFYVWMYVKLCEQILIAVMKKIICIANFI